MSHSTSEKPIIRKADTSSINFDAYYERIHFNGERTPTLDALKSIHLLHPQYIPFENLNPLLRIPVKLDMPSLMKKILLQNRGGYCFEQNLLLKGVLESLGFNVKGLAARILWNQPAEKITPRGHMLLLLEIDSVSYIADVGFGGQTLTAPLVLKSGVVQQTPHEPYRLMAVGEEYTLETLVRNEWKPLYRFDLREQFLVDYEVSSWYLSNHPDSHFVTGLIAARTEPNRRFALRNNELAIHDIGGLTERKVITGADELQAILLEVFGLSVSDTPGLKAALKKVCEGK